MNDYQKTKGQVQLFPWALVVTTWPGVTGGHMYWLFMHLKGSYSWSGEKRLVITCLRKQTQTWFRATNSLIQKHSSWLELPPALECSRLLQTNRSKGKTSSQTTLEQLRLDEYDAFAIKSWSRQLDVQQIFAHLGCFSLIPHSCGVKQ